MPDDRAQRAYDLGKAVAEGQEDLPLPDDSVIETVIDGVPVRVLLVEPPHE